MDDLIALRMERGLSQRQFAVRAGVKQPVIARIEAGRAKNLELRTIVRLATALGAPVKVAFQKIEAAKKPTKRKLANSA
jgi:transcriptional regulator with XRE-family HTH domain